MCSCGLSVHIMGHDTWVIQTKQIEFYFLSLQIQT